MREHRALVSRPTIPAGSQLVVSTATLWAAHGLAYSIFSRVRQREQLVVYRHQTELALPNLVDPYFLVPSSWGGD